MFVFLLTFSIVIIEGIGKGIGFGGLGGLGGFGGYGLGYGLGGLGEFWMKKKNLFYNRYMYLNEWMSLSFGWWWMKFHAMKLMMNKLKNAILLPFFLHIKI